MRVPGRGRTISLTFNLLDLEQPITLDIPGTGKASESGKGVR